MVTLVWPKVPSNLSSVSHRLTPERIAGLVEGNDVGPGQLHVRLDGVLVLLQGALEATDRLREIPLLAEPLSGFLLFPCIVWLRLCLARILRYCL